MTEETGVPLLSTKLHIPPRRPGLVDRPRLAARLDDALRLQHRLTLVSARAGTGKTTLVSDWLHRQERAARWLSLDAGDNDPRRFLGYLLAAFDAVGVKSDAGRLEALQVSQPDALMTELVNEVSSSGVASLLVFDDYHVIQSDWVHQAIGFLAEHLPPAMHLILITRVDPPLPLARLRGRGLLTEIRDQDLRFTAEEAAQFLTGMGLELTGEAVATLEQRTEGWIVGLQMAGISMRGRKQSGDSAAFLEAFRGTNRYVLDYLTEEVLNQQTPGVQDFLIETSILSRMCAELCDAVRFGDAEAVRFGDTEARQLQETGAPGDDSATEARSAHGGGPDSQSVLSQLERSNLFVTPLDEERRWYRYHHLFADLIRSTLHQQRPVEQVRELHRRASCWHQSAGSLEEAMTHAIAAHDFERAADMIEENIATMLSRSEAPLLLGWIDKLPEQVVRDRHWIDVNRAYTLALSGQLDQVDRLLEAVEQRLEPGAPQASELLGHTAALRAYAANLRGDAPRAIEMAALTERYLPDQHLNARGMAAYALADTLFASDDMDGAEQASRQMLRVGEETGRLLMSIPALCDLAAISKVRGQLHQARELYDRAWQRLAERNALDSRVRCPYEVGLADLLREWGELDAAREHALTGIEYCRRFGVYSLLVSGYVVLMRILQALGETEGALDALGSAERTMDGHYHRLAARIELKAARVVQWLAAGDIASATRCAEACGDSEPEQMALARLWLAQGRTADAQRLLNELRARAAAGRRRGREVEILSLLALALEASGRSPEADAAVSEAVSLARPDGYMQVFLDLGSPLGRMVERAATSGHATGSYFRDLLDAFGRQRETVQDLPVVVSPAGPSPAETMADPLTEREVEVLQLLAEGLSNKKIGERLVVAPSTVKQHLKHIYGKLDVHSRTQAVARGRELGLF